MRHRLLALPLLAAPLLAQSQPTFYAAFQDGQDAEQRGDWVAAAAAYRRAILLRPQPAARVIIYGNNLLTRYYPYVRLARCELELGRREAAEAALAQAAAHGEPAQEREPLHRRLKALEDAARSPGAAPAPAPPVPAPAAPGASEPPPQAPAPASPPPVAAPSAPTPILPAAPTPEPRPRPEGGAAAPPEASAKAEPGTPPAGPAAPSPGQPRRWPLLLGAGAAALLAGALAAGFRRRRAGSGPEGFREPDRLGPYRIERLLGRGGFASTYLARHEATNAPVALKVLHPYRQDDAEFLRRFRLEARLGARLDHPNLVRILDPGPEEGLPYLAMELVEGRTLDDRLRGGALPVAEACGIARDVARAMVYAHARGVVHRDLKPANILLTPAGARVTDLGIARVVDEATVTTTYAFLGTPLYAAPEAQQRTHVGPAADRYSLGVILFQMVAGVPPFQGETPFQILDAHRAAPPPDLAALRPGVPADLARLVADLLAKEPDRRPGDEALLAALEALTQEPRRDPST